METTRVDFLYGKGALSLDIDNDRLKAVLLPKETAETEPVSQEEIIKRAYDAPIGSPALSELAKGKYKVVIIASDHTRPVPSKLIIPRMLKEIREGNPAADITILVATGCHRETTREELVNKFGEEIVNSEKIAIHIASDDAAIPF